MIRGILIAWMVAALAGCVTPPAEPALLLPARAPLDGASRAAAGGSPWPAAAWWQALGDAQLSALITRAQLSGPTLETARARIDAARAAGEVYAAESGDRATAGAGLSRQRLSDTGLISSRLIGFTYYDDAEVRLGLDLDLDWWDRRRAGLNAGLDRARAAQAERRGAELALASALASTYLAWQIDGERLATTSRLVETLKSLLELQSLRTRQGMDSADSLLALEMDEAVAEDSSTVLAGSVVMRRVELAALVGVAADDLQLASPGCAVVAHLEQPPDAGLGIMARRPDIVASRWRVEAAAEDVAQARAGFYPDIRLSALAGLSSLDLAKLLNPGSRIASIGGALYLPIFDARGVRARHGARVADLELAVANYNETVIASAQDVATQVYALQGLSDRRTQILRRLASARSLEQSARSIEDRGIDDQRASLKARADVLRLEDSDKGVEGELMVARIALIKALGGGIEGGL